MGFTKEELLFAQHFPYTQKAVQIVKQSSFALDKVPESVIYRAKVIVSNALSFKQYEVSGASYSEDMLLDEILAYPVAKIFLSLIGRTESFGSFARMFSNACFKYLEKEKSNEAMLELADEMKIKYSLSQKKAFFVELPLMEFLSASFSEEFMKLVNQKIENGTVFLSRHDFARYESAIVFNKIKFSLPIPTKEIPKNLKDASKELSSRMTYTARTSPSSIAYLGKIQPELFAPCMAELYAQLLEGKKLSHTERFDLATFLSALNIPTEQIVKLFSRTPNFKEHLTRYHIERIKGKGGRKYSAPSCAKMKEHKLCNANDSCEGIKSPIGYYLRELKTQKKKA